MKFIHIGDVHLGMKPDKGMPWSDIRQKEIKESFFGLLEICNQEEVDLLLIAGDLFHNQPLVKELKEINYGFSKLTNTKVILIAGNHDYISERSHYSNFPWCEQVVMLDSEKMDSFYLPKYNTRVYGFSYHKRDILDARYTDAYPEDKECINILLAHGGDEKDIPINKNNLKSLGYDYVALGHIHKHEFISDRVAYCGSLEPLDKNETGRHGYIIGNVHKSFEGRKDEFEFIPYGKREYIHLEVEVEASMTNGEILDYIKKQHSILGVNNIYKLILKGIRDSENEVDINSLYKVGNIIQVMDETVPDYDFSELYYQNKNNIIGMYIEEIRHSNEEDDIADKALYYGIEALLKAKG